jgi:hypothetical protein
MSDDPELLTMQELADRLKRSYSYIKRMRQLGFRMVAGRTTLKAALIWLEKNPAPCSSQKRG